MGAILPVLPKSPFPARALSALHPLNQEEKKWDFNQFWGIFPSTEPFISALQPPVAPGSSALQADTVRGKRQISVLQ